MQWSQELAGDPGQAVPSCRPVKQQAPRSLLHRPLPRPHLQAERRVRIRQLLAADVADSGDALDQRPQAALHTARVSLVGGTAGVLHGRVAGAQQLPGQRRAHQRRRALRVGFHHRVVRLGRRLVGASGTDGAYSSSCTRPAFMRVLCYSTTQPQDRAIVALYRQQAGGTHPADAHPDAIASCPALLALAAAIAACPAAGTGRACGRGRVGRRLCGCRSAGSGGRRGRGCGRCGGDGRLLGLSRCIRRLETRLAAACCCRPALLAGLRLCRAGSGLGLLALHIAGRARDSGPGGGSAGSCGLGRHAWLWRRLGLRHGGCGSIRRSIYQLPGYAHSTAVPHTPPRVFAALWALCAPACSAPLLRSPMPLQAGRGRVAHPTTAPSSLTAGEERHVHEPSLRHVALGEEAARNANVRRRLWRLYVAVKLHLGAVDRHGSRGGASDDAPGAEDRRARGQLHGRDLHDVRGDDALARDGVKLKVRLEGLAKGLGRDYEPLGWR